MRFQDLPIQRKLVGVIFLTILAALGLACVALLAYELRGYRETTTRQMSTIARIIALNSSAILIFDDEKMAAETLSGLRAEPDVTEAALYDANGRIIAVYPPTLARSSLPALRKEELTHVGGRDLIIYCAVSDRDGRLGTLYMKADLTAMYKRFQIYGVVMFAVSVGAGAFALGASAFFQKIISQPIRELAAAAKVVSEKKDFSIRATKRAEDEVGFLTEAFNAMLEQIQESQARLQEHAEQLEKRVAERTAKLTETVSELESFSYSISHDMRAPLRAMQGYSDLVLEDYGKNLGPEGKDYLQRIVRASRRMDALIQDILTYSRVARADMNLEEIDLKRLTDEIIQQSPAFQPPNADVQTSGSFPLVHGHDASLTQVLSNLIGNSVKFVAPGQKPIVRIRCEPINGCVRVWVEDNGIGIAPQHLGRIFSIFERVHGSSSYEGTGIGLSIVRKAVERMGGKVGVESELGRGSRFWFELPIAGVAHPVTVRQTTAETRQ
jgi:signal transduction histidine kinase